MFKRKIGDKRKFEKYAGDWEVVELIENKNIQHDLTLGKTKCPNCGCLIGEKQRYTFNYIEKLKQDGKTIHLGISECGRYVILEEYNVEVKDGN